MSVNQKMKNFLERFNIWLLNHLQVQWAPRVMAPGIFIFREIKTTFLFYSAHQPSLGPMHVLLTAFKCAWFSASWRTEPSDPEVFR